MAGMSLQASDASEFEAVFTLMASSKTTKLKVQAPDTLFLDQTGTVVSYFTPSKGSLLRIPDKKVSQDSLGQFVASCCKAGSSQPQVAIARYREANHLLTASELKDLVDTISATVQGKNTSMGEGPLPYALQRLVEPRGDRRFVTTFMWADTDVICESFQSRFSGAYARPPPDPGATNGRGGAEYGGSRPSTVGGEGGDQLWASAEEADKIPRKVLLELRQSTLGAVNYINKVHDLQVVGLVLEHVADASGQLWLVAVLGTCWADMWYRHRQTNADGRLFCSHPDLKSVEGPHLPSSMAPRHSPGPLAYAKPGPYQGKARRELLPKARPPPSLTSTFGPPPSTAPGSEATAALEWDGAEAADAEGGGAEAEGGPGALVPHPPGSGLLPSSPPEAAGSGSRAARVKYGLESDVAAAIASPRFSPRMSERGVWAGPRDSPVREALRASAASLVSSGRAPKMTATGYSQRGRANPPLVVHLTRRLEEVRGSLQVQVQRAAASELAELRWRESKQRADGERERVQAALAEADLRYRRDLEAWQAEEARLVDWGTRANGEAAELQHHIGALQDERDALKARMDYERECAVDISGDLKRRLDATRQELETLQQESDATLRAVEGDKTILEASLAEERKKSVALMDHLKEQQVYAHELEQSVREMRVALAAISAERDNLLRSMPNVSVDSRQEQGSNLIAPEEIEDLLAKEENQAAELLIINRVLKESSTLLRQIFRYYATLRDRGHERMANIAARDESMGMSEFSKFCKDCKLIDRVTIDNIKVDQIFVKVNFNAKAALAGDRMIEFDEFSEALVRLAHARYKHLAHVSDKLQKILEADVFPNAKRTTTLITEAKKKKRRGAPRCLRTATKEKLDVEGGGGKEDGGGRGSSRPVSGAGSSGRTPRDQQQQRAGSGRQPRQARPASGAGGQSANFAGAFSGSGALGIAGGAPVMSPPEMPAAAASS